MDTKNQPDKNERDFDVAVVGDFAVLRSPTGEIIHFKPEEALAVAKRLVHLSCGSNASTSGENGEASKD